MIIRELMDLWEADDAKASIPRKKKKYYVGVKGTKMNAFLSDETPTEKSHGDRYAAVIGPFKTKKAAMFMAAHGYNNPHLQTVADAERIANKK